MRRENSRGLGWNTDYKRHSKDTHFRLKIKWRLCCDVWVRRPLWCIVAKWSRDINKWLIYFSSYQPNTGPVLMVSYVVCSKSKFQQIKYHSMPLLLLLCVTRWTFDTQMTLGYDEAAERRHCHPNSLISFFLPAYFSSLTDAGVGIALQFFGTLPYFFCSTFQL